MQDTTLNIKDLSVNTDVYTENEGTPENEVDAEKVYRVFKTQEEFQSVIDRAMGKRLSKMRETEKELESINDTLKDAFDRFNVTSISELLSHFENAQNNSQEATLDAEALENELDALSRSEGGLFSTEQAKALLADERTKTLIKTGFSLKDTISLCLLPELLKEQREKERESVIREIRTRGLRPREDATTGFGSFSATLDPKNLTAAQRADIKERVRRGERITF